MKTNVRPQRNPNLEMLRILAILAIIGYHFYTQTAVCGAPASSFSHCTAMFLGSFGRAGVNVFVLIGAWFLIDLPFRSMRMIRLYVPCLCYASVVTVLVILFGHISKGVAAKELLRALTPFSSSPLWFVSDYLFLLFLTPFLNVLVHTLELRKYRVMLWILIAVFVVIPTAESALPGFGIYRYYIVKSDMAWLIVLYLIAGYWKRTPDCGLQKKAGALLAGLILLCACLCLADCLLARYASQGFVVRKYHDFMEFLFMDLSSAFCFSLAAAAFFFFRHIEIDSPALSNAVNRISKNILGIYIIHQIPVFIPVLWGVFRTGEWLDSPWFLPLEIATVLSVFTAAWIADNLGSLLLKPLLNAAWLQNLSKKIDAAVNA